MSDFKDPYDDLLYYDADGNRVSEPAAGGKQYQKDDPLRPDAAKKAAPKVFGTDSFSGPANDAETGGPSEKAVAPAANKARKSSANK